MRSSNHFYCLSIAKLIYAIDTATDINTAMSSSSTKPLQDLSNAELERWLTSINLKSVLSNVKELSVTGEILSYCNTVKHLEDLGFGNVHARILLKNILVVRVLGVQLSAISPPGPSNVSAPAPAPAPAAPSAPIQVVGKGGNWDIIFIS